MPVVGVARFLAEVNRSVGRPLTNHPWASWSNPPPVSATQPAGVGTEDGWKLYFTWGADSGTAPSSSPLIDTQFNLVLVPVEASVSDPSVTVTSRVPVWNGVAPVGTKDATRGCPSTETPWTESRYPASPTDPAT